MIFFKLSNKNYFGFQSLYFNQFDENMILKNQYYVGHILTSDICCGKNILHTSSNDLTSAFDQLLKGVWLLRHDRLIERLDHHFGALSALRGPVDDVRLGLRLILFDLRLTDYGNIKKQD